MRSLIVMLLATLAAAQQIPAGTAIPVTLNTALDSRKLRAGETIRATVAQDVPLASKTKLRSGSHIYGRILEAGTTPNGTFVRFRFDDIHAKHGGETPVTTSLRALASPFDVQRAMVPDHVPYRGETPANWTTNQIGGDVVYRGGGPVTGAGGAVVGKPVPDGVLAELTPEPESGCPDGSNGHEVAVWVFSSGACGVFGTGDDLHIEHAGRTNPVGEIVLQAKGRLYVRPGSALLLITEEPQRK